jgi:mannitol/fructose-specific phosphotransferase system IIA component (Ntr-type)
MKLQDFIVRQAIIPSLSATDRDSAVREMVTAIASAGALEGATVDEVVAAVIHRERDGSTGFGKGIAVPHVKLPKIKKMVGTIARSATGIDFSALDHQPVFSFVLLLSPASAPEDHLKAMNIIFSSLQKDMFRKFLRQADTQQKIMDLVEEADAGK